MFIAPIQPIETFEEMRAGQKTASSASGIPFASLLQESLDELRRSQAQSEKDSIDLALGQGGDLHTMKMCIRDSSSRWTSTRAASSGTRTRRVRTVMKSPPAWVRAKAGQSI